MLSQPPPNKYIQESEMRSRMGIAYGKPPNQRFSRKAALVALAIILIVTIGGVILLYMVG